jgi:hypothetical protein
MNGNFFDRLEVELSGLARQGTHLDGSAGRDRRRLMALIRRGALIAVLALVLAASLASEFPSSASGHAAAAQISVAHPL